jgi:putative aldouronate transport system permease protein
MSQLSSEAAALMKPRKKKRKYDYRRYRPLLIMMIPGLIYILINNYLPMFGIVIAFKEVNFAKGIFAGDWVGFKNFEFLFASNNAWIITRNTILYNLVFLVLGTVLSFIVALMLNEVKNKFMLRSYQAIISMPHLISWVIVSYLVFAFLSVDNGFMNRTILPMLGIDEDIYWYTEPKYWPYILTLVDLWKRVGYGSIVYFAALLGINDEYYEAARLDGASRLQQIWHITLPIVVPVIIMMAMLQLGRIFYSDFGLFYQVTLNSGILFSTTATIDTYVFNGLMGSGNLGMSTAAGVYQSIVGFILVLTVNYLVRRKDRENAFF